MVDRKSHWFDAHGARREVIAQARLEQYKRPDGLQGSSGLFLCGVVLLSSACGQKAPEPPPPPAPQVQAAPQPLVFAFNEPAPWKSQDGSKVVQPPDLEAETWRVMVNQTEPMQRKNPWWQPVKARETVELEMPPGSKFRCRVPPLNIAAEPDEYGSDLEAWQFKRSFLCSNDEFRTWTETQLRVRQSTKGKRKVGPEAGILLRERADDGKVHETFVMMRSDKEKTTAEIGPPKIIEKQKDEDDE
ncbi:MAG TPA: hypothetical protein VFN67_37945 [Polyangiales bacterium]|nr:hypothetical protein [Polyangiales bacterium]